MKSRNTRQKEKMHDEMQKLPGFFTAEELYSRVSGMGIGLATVYRHLKALRDCGQVYSYTCAGRLVYSVGKKSHCHFVCEKTGKVIHFDISSLDFLKDKIPGNISSFQIEVRGVCRDCT